MSSDDDRLILFTNSPVGGWKSPARAVTRASYMIARLTGSAALVLFLAFLSLEWSEEECFQVPLIFESLLLLSYTSTSIILLFRTLSLYSGNSRLDRSAQWGMSFCLLNFVVWTAVHMKSVKGTRLPYTEGR